MSASTELKTAFSGDGSSDGGIYLVLEHVHVVVRRLWLLIGHLLQVANQIWHVYPEVLGVALGFCNGVAGWQRGGRGHF